MQRPNQPNPSLPTRRAFLAYASSLAAASLSLGCAPDAAAPSAPPVAPPPDFLALKSTLKGPLLQPGDAGFGQAAQLFQPRFDGILPRAIAQCADAADVQTAVRWAVASGVPVRVRAGGHSYAGYCTAAAALVIDVRALNAVSLDPATNRLRVGAGTLIVDAQAALWPGNLALSTGSCPTVGMAGLTLGGGYGLAARALGLTCDALVSLDMVLADGSLVTCDATQNADLFWAARGGGGGNFGVVTALTYQATPVAQATSFSVNWPWAQAAQVVRAWQQWAPTAPDALTSELQLFAGGEGDSAPRVSVGGGFMGTSEALKPILAQLYVAAGQPSGEDMQTDTYAKIAPTWLDCDGVVAHCHLEGRSARGKVVRESYFARSDYFKAQLPDAAVQLLLDAVEARGGNPLLYGVQFGAYGGAIAKVPSDATAFVHRDALFVSQYLAFGAQPADRIWIDGAYNAMRPYVSGQAYQNYIDPGLSDWRNAYYGQNLKRLQDIKAARDPARFFDFAQAV